MIHTVAKLEIDLGLQISRILLTSQKPSLQICKPVDRTQDREKGYRLCLRNDLNLVVKA
jgi:hypothetical protein